MSRENVWNLEISFVGSGEEAARAKEIIVAVRKRRKHIYGQGPWWYVRYKAVEARAAALAALTRDLDEIDPRWRDILAVR